MSHTFILREILALRDAGLEVMTCSVRRTGPEHYRGAAEQEAARSTFYLLAAAKQPRRLLGAQMRLWRSPKRYFSALSLAWRTRAPGLRALLYQGFYFVEATVLADHLEAAKATHIHNHFANASGSVAMLTAALTGLPYSFTLHGPSDLLSPDRWRLDVKAARARFVACISHFARSQLMLHSDPADWHKYRIVHCGVVPTLYERADTSRTGKHFVFVGRVAAVKGLRVLITALTQALKSDPDLRLTIVGDGDDRRNLQALAAPLGNAVRFTGYQSQEEVAAILASADALVLPSFAEGVPVVLMEAMASGKPVIATRVAGVAELVEDGISGYLTAPGDAVGLAETLLRVSRDGPRRAEMGAAGRKRVRDEFDIASEARWLAQIFRGEDEGRIRP